MTSKVYNWIRSRKDKIAINSIKLYDGLAIYNISDIIFYRNYMDVAYEAHPYNKCTRKTIHYRCIQNIDYLNEQP